MDENASIFNLFLYEFEELIEEFDEVLVFMIKDWVNNVIYIVLRFVGDLIHGGSCGDN